MPFDREKMAKAVAHLASRGVYIGTSSWKYEGWLGQLYSRSRYLKAQKSSKPDAEADLLPGLGLEPKPKPPEQLDEERFDKECLSEYSEVFKTVCIDGAYYKFPTRPSLEKLAAQVPDDFRFGFKVTDAITVKRYPFHPKSGAKAGKLNPEFLNAELFAKAFLGPCEAIRRHVGVTMFEFSRFGHGDYPDCPAFVADLDKFFGNLPKGWPYAVELRNQDFLTPEYFACLRKQGITHVFNNWDAMPPVSEQMVLPGSRTNPSLLGVRFLLKPGRKYQTAVDLFKPYTKVKEPNPDARAAGAALIAERLANKDDGKTYIYVNNRLEGNALESINAMIDEID